MPLDLRDLNICLLASWIQRYHEKLWRIIINAKYNSNSPNIFCCNDRHGSSFWNRVLWAAKAAKMGYR
jgi:hypothetical protein